jgi:hypothetical protein
MMRATLLCSFIAVISWSAIALADITPRNILNLSGPLDCGDFGFNVSSAGDFNGDGYKDILVGSRFSWLPSGLDGQVFVYYGGPRADSLPDMVLQAPPNTVDFGMTISAAGDFNGDGYDDIVVGDHWLSSGFFVYFGGPNADDRPDLFLFVPYQFFRQPAQIRSGDVNGDGYSDLVATFGTPRLRAFVYLGGPSADGLPDLELKSPDEFMQGPVVLDENGDGVKDIAMLSRGGIGIYFGGANLDSLEDLHLAGPMIDGRYISALESAGDVNGDGSDDLMASTSGNVLVYFGGPGADNFPDATLHGDDSRSAFGATKAPAGDVDGDGYGDILIGDFDYAGDGGKLLLYRGGAEMDTVPEVTITRSDVSSGFPYGVTAIDVNGDGIAEAFGTLERSCEYGTTQAESNLVLIYDLAASLNSRAFVQGGDRTVPMRGNGAVCLRLEPMNGSFSISDVDLSTVRLSSRPGLSAISPEAGKHMVASDTDGNGVAELPIWFSLASLSGLFPDVHGRHVVNATLDGTLIDRRHFSAPVALTILGAPQPSLHVISISPNPMNPVGNLLFSTPRTGAASVRVYDVLGRLVREVIHDDSFPAGEHTIILDGKDGQGRPLASGIYFYSVESAGESRNGRFVIAR